MRSIKYGVVILNYRTADDSIVAAKTVINCAKTDEYQICIVDGGSNLDYDKNILLKQNLQNTDVLILDDNKGYGVSNNAGIRYLAHNYNPMYIVIMNPDVQIVKYGTIEGIIENVEGCGAAGGQPLVCTPWLKEPPEWQINIRGVYSYQDCLIESFFLLKKVFKRKYEAITYRRERPYITNIKYYCPSGAFFLLKTEKFEELGLFDEETFLYNEELILGHKLKEANSFMLLVPQYKVIHESGKSIGSNSKRISRFAANENKKSMKIYLKNYLYVGENRILLVMALMEMNYILKKSMYILKDCIFILKKYIYAFTQYFIYF